MAYSTIRLVAYDVATQTRIDALSTADQISFDSPHCSGGLPTLTFTVAADPRDTRILATMPALAVEIYDGAQWLEVRNGRFHVVGSDADSLDPRGAAQITAIHVARLFTGGRCGTGPGMTSDGAWRTTAVGPGALRAFMERDQDRGWWPSLNFDFTADADSAGQPWAWRRQREYSPVDDFASLLEAVVSGGEAEWTMQGETLSMFNPDGGLAADRTAVKLRLARSTEAPEKRSLDGVVTSVIVKGEGGKTFEVTNPSATPRWGKITTSVEATGVTTQAQAQAQAMPMLVAGQDVREQFTRRFDLTLPGTPRPFIDYQVGDWVSVERVVDGATRVDQARVMKVALQGETGHVTLGTLLDSLEQKLLLRAKRVAPVVGGDSTTRPPAPDLATPVSAAAPRVEAFTETYISAGYPLGRVRLQWPPVTRAAVQKPGAEAGCWVESADVIECDQYWVMAWCEKSLQGLKPGQFVDLGVTEGTDYVHEGLTPGEVWRYGVVARAKGQISYGPALIAWPVGYSGTTRSPSSHVTVLIDRDIIPPPAPSLPVLSTQWATVTVKWDRLTSTGAEMPEDFVRVDVEARVQSTGDTWQAIGSADLVTDFLIHGNLTAGTIYEYRARAVDRSANMSPWSAIASITVLGIDADPAYVASRDAAIAAASADIRADMAGDIAAMQSEIAVTVDAAKAAAATAQSVADAAQVDADAAQAVADAATGSAAAARAAAAAKPDQWGALSAPPTKSRDGGALVVGSTYQDATAGNATLMWSGTAWVPVIFSDGAITNLTSASIKTYGLSADRVLIGQGINLVPNADFETGTAPHTVVGGTLSTNSTATSGRQSLQVVAAASATQTQVFLGGPARLNFTAATPGEQYSFKVKYIVQAGSPTFVRLQVFQYDKDWAYLSSAIPVSHTTWGTGWMELQGTVSVPNVAAAYALPVVVVGTASGATATVLLDSALYAQKATGSLIVDGAITTNLIAADAVQATNIASDAIQAKHIAADAVQATNIASDAIQAKHIAADAVQARHISSYSIDATKLLIGAGTNLIPNPNIEAGIAPHSAANGTLTATTADAWGGTTALAVTATPGSTSTTVYLGGTTRIPVRPGDEYHWTVTYRVASGTATTVRLQAYQYRADGSYAGSSVPPEGTESPPSTAWRTLNGSMKVTDRAVAGVLFTVVMLSSSGESPVLYIDDIRAAVKGTGQLIVDGSIRGTHIAGETITAGNINTGSLAADTGFVGSLWANQIFVGTATAKLVTADMFNGKVFNGGTFNGQTVNASRLNGAIIDLLSENYSSGLLRVRRAGNYKSIQLDANGLHMLPDYRSGARAFSLDVDSQRLVFYGDGNGEIAMQGTYADLRIRTNYLANSDQVAAIMFDTKHAAGDVRNRAPAITWHANPAELRIDGYEMAGSVAGGTGISLGYNGDQDAIALGNIYQFAGYMYRSNGAGAYILPGNTTWPRLEFTASRAVIGVSAGQAVGMIDMSTAGTRIYASGAGRALNGNINVGINVVTIDSRDGTRIEKYLSVGGDVAASGAIRGSSKPFERPHVIPEKAALGMILRHCANEAPVNGVHYWDSTATDPLTLGDDGTIEHTLPDYVPYLTHEHLSIQVTLIGDAPAPVAAKQTGPGRFRVTGPPGGQVHYLVFAVRKDIAPLVVEEVDLDRSIALNDYEPVSDAVSAAISEAMDAATNPLQDLDHPNTNALATAAHVLSTLPSVV